MRKRIVPVPQRGRLVSRNMLAKSRDHSGKARRDQVLLQIRKDLKPPSKAYYCPGPSRSRGRPEMEGGGGKGQRCWRWQAGSGRRAWAPRGRTPSAGRKRYSGCWRSPRPSGCPRLLQSLHSPSQGRLYRFRALLSLSLPAAHSWFLVRRLAPRPLRPWPH